MINLLLTTSILVWPFGQLLSLTPFGSAFRLQLLDVLAVFLFISLLPSVLLSGFVFPLEYMPIFIQVLSHFFPGRYFVNAIRGIYLKGIGLSILWPDAVLLFLFAVGIVWLSASRFRGKLE